MKAESDVVMIEYCNISTR